MLENTGPKRILILGRLSGGPLEHTGVMQGMSGSPVYIDGKLIGAVALAFPYAKDPIAGIRPIEEMLRVDAAAGAAPARVTVPACGATLCRSDVPCCPRPSGAGYGGTRMTEVATPLSLSGFTARPSSSSRRECASSGLEPRQGISTGGAPEDRMGDPPRCSPAR